MMRLTHFYKKDEKIRKQCVQEFFSKQWKDILASVIFIILSSNKRIFSLKNGALWVFLWYAISVLLSLYAYIDQSEYLAGVKKARHFAKKHKGIQVEKGHNIIPENGGWNNIMTQYLSVLPMTSICMIFALVQQIYYYSYYMNNYKDFYMGLFIDTSMSFFVTFYNKCIVSEMIAKESWYERKDYFLHAFNGRVIKNIIIHIPSLVIICFIMKHYYLEEFSGLFSSTSSRILGIIYIIYITKDILLDILKKSMKFVKTKKICFAK